MKVIRRAQSHLNANAWCAAVALHFFVMIWCAPFAAAQPRAPSCDWPAIKSAYVAGQIAQSAPDIGACIPALERAAIADPGFTISAGALSYVHHAHAQALALEGAFLSAETAMNTGQDVARRHGFNNTPLVPLAAIHAATHGLIFECQGRTRDAIAAYERGEYYGRAALLAFDLGDTAEARRLVSLNGPLGDQDAHIVRAAFAEAAGDTALAIVEYQAAWTAIAAHLNGRVPSLPIYFLEAGRVRAALARLGAPVP